MLSNPKNGWCEFRLGEFRGTPSYLTNVPMDVLDMCLDYQKKGAGICYFDEEGPDFVLIFAHGEVFIIACRGEQPSLYQFNQITPEKLIKEIVNDFTTYCR